MKKLFLLLAFVPLLAMGQQSFPLVKDGGIWREIYVGKNEPPTTFFMLRDQLLMEGDTVFNNQVYKKLYRCEYGPFISYKDFYGGIREDSHGKVYFYESFSGQPEYLVYDFSLEVGDTLGVIADFNLIQVLESIDSVLIDNQYRKRYIYRTHFGLQKEVIEGIGSVKGLFFLLSHEFEHYQLLTCYEDSDIFWNNPDLNGNDCFSVGVEESMQHKKGLSVYPVPVTDKLHVVFEDIPRDQVIIQLYDITGRLIEGYQFAGQKEIILDVANIKQGTYIMHVNSDYSGSHSFKIIRN